MKSRVARSVGSAPGSTRTATVVASAGNAKAARCRRCIATPEPVTRNAIDSPGNACAVSRVTASSGSAAASSSTAQLASSRCFGLRVGSVVIAASGPRRSSWRPLVTASTSRPSRTACSARETAALTPSSNSSSPPYSSASTSSTTAIRARRVSSNWRTMSRPVFAVDFQCT